MQNATNQENLLMAKTLRELKDIIQDLRTTFTETGIPIDDDNKDFHKFCAKLELILFQGTKEKTGIFGSNKRSPYNFFSTVLAKSKNANEGLKYVRYNAEIRTSNGKLRCFVRYLLFHGLFADAIQSCLSEQTTVSEFYDFSSVFSSRSLSENLVSALYDLNDVQFDLNPAGFELDAEWPTFAKKQFAGHNWRTPSVYSSPTSQSGSFTSLTSDVTSPRLLRRSFFSRSASETESSPMDHSDPEEQLSAAQQQIQLLTGANCKMEEEIKNLNEELRKAREVALNSESKLELLQNTHNLEISRLQQQIEELQQQILTFETTNQRAAALEVQVSSLREAGMLCKRLLSIRENEVVLLKEQLHNTELKVTAFKERYKIKKLLLVQEEQNLREKIENLEKTMDRFAAAEYLDEVDIPPGLESEAAEKLKNRIQLLLKENSQKEKEILSLKETMLQHETRLSSVASELDNTWNCLSKLKMQHGQLQNEEVVLKYELKEKRQLLDKLKQQLETSREKCRMAQQQNSETQQQWQTMREELDTRKAETKATQPMDLVSGIADIPVKEEEPIPAVLDEREERLKLLEEECKLLCSRLMNSSSKSAALLGKVDLIHEQHSRDKETLQEAVEVNENPEVLPSGADVEVVNEELETAKEEARSLRFQLSTQQLEYERSSQALEEQHQGLQGALDKQREYEALIQGLREELHAVVNLANQEKTVFHNEMANMRLALMTREEECQGLSDELRATVAEKDEMHVELDNLKTQLLEMKESADKIQDRLQNELTALKDESQQLRRKVVTLIKEKDALWHRSDRLLQWHRILETDKWVPDQQVDKCQSCSNAFSFTLRRHHCRLCGRIFCYSCANVWLKTPGHRYKVRICNECYIVHNEASQIENNCNFNDSNDTEATDSGMVNNADDKIAENSGENGPVAMETEIYEKICQEFTVISDEEIIKSLGESSPYTRSPLAGTDYRKIWMVAPRSADSLLEDGEMEVYLNAAMIYRIPVELSDPGFLLKWRVKTKPKSVVVVLLQQVPDAIKEAATEAAEATESAERVDSAVVLTTTRVKSLPHFTEGQQLLQTPGTYFFDLDNSHSKFLAKKVTFSLCVQKTPSPNDAMDASS